MYSVPGWKCWRICRRLPLRNTRIKRRISVPRQPAEALLRRVSRAGSPFAANANILHEYYPSHQAIMLHVKRFFRRRHAVLRQGAEGWVRWGRPYALACNVTTLSGRVAPPPVAMIGGRDAHRGLDQTIKGNADSKSAEGGVGLLRRPLATLPRKRGRVSTDPPRLAGEGSEGDARPQAHEETPHVSPNLDRRSAGRDAVPIHCRRESRGRQVSQ